jgi:hypothetical protein
MLAMHSRQTTEEKGKESWRGRDERERKGRGRESVNWTRNVEEGRPRV